MGKAGLPIEVLVEYVSLFQQAEIMMRGMMNHG